MPTRAEIMVNIMEQHEQQRGGKTMKRLFKVVDCKGRMVWDQPEDALVGDGTTLMCSKTGFTHDKMVAKDVRDFYNEHYCNGPYTVSRGPDHIGPHGHSIARMRLQPKHVNSYAGL